MPARIGVIGSGGRIDEDVAKAAQEIGSRIAEGGGVVICGGKGGVMEWACKGAVSRGGLTVGLLPESHTLEINKFVRMPIPTGMDEARNYLIVRCSDVVIALAGGWGTLSEIALGMDVGKPVVVLKGFGGVSDRLSGWSLLDNKIFELASTPEQAVELAFTLAEGRATNKSE